MKTGLGTKTVQGKERTGAARCVALAAIIGLGAAAAGNSACSAAQDENGFGAGGSGSSQSNGAGAGAQNGATSGTATDSVGAFANGVGSGGAGATSTSGVGGACASSHHEGKETPLDIYIMLDKSGSMNTSSKWTNCTNALKAFVQSPEAAGIGVGLQYFPLDVPPPAACSLCTDCTCIFGPTCGCSGCSCTNGVCTCLSGTAVSCQVADHATPAVPIGVLPGNAQALINSMNSISPNGNTPTRPALEGALTHARDWTIANPDHKVVVVLATDGVPSTSVCAPNTIADSQNVAQTFLNGTPSIQTYVIGVGTTLTSLDAIAMAGGTNMAYIVDSGGNTTQQFIDAMNAIRQSAGLACEYQLPQGTMVDINKVNVQYIPGNGGPTEDILHAQTAANCHPTLGGWYYDNNTNPTKIIMCPATCMKIEADDMGQIDILLGCETVELPPF